jgi:hypothetical protein
MAKLTSGSIRASRRDRWAVRRKISELRLLLGYGKWFLYAVYEHLFDLASPATSSNQLQVQLHYWELAEDLGVSESTISRRLKKLEEIGLLEVIRAKSDTSPGIITLLGP